MLMQKQAICGIIDAVWGKGVISSNRPENINSDVIAVVTDVVNSIKTCSKYFLAADIAYNFYIPHQEQFMKCYLEWQQT